MIKVCIFDFVSLSSPYDDPVEVNAWPREQFAFNCPDGYLLYKIQVKHTTINWNWNWTQNFFVGTW